MRSGAKVGDLIFVTGALGGAAAGLKLLENGERYGPSDLNNLLLRQLAPNPQIEVGKLIGENKLATAMIDLSDGLVGDLFHICQQSHIGAKLFADKIPDQFDLEKYHPFFSLSEMINFLLYSGEDFELLFTVNPKKIFQLEKKLKNYQIFAIGEVTANTEIIELSANEKLQILEPKGFRHF